ncbi:MAG: SMP-30/gluconolactonase/LRE family protein [Acidobacteria bacterium]|nr:SMP-30/gluconolactonase/LRE family protein [Acidobacteriota bacterium]
MLVTIAMLPQRLVVAVLFAALALPAQSPFPAGAKPVNLGRVGASEGPVWHPGQGVLYFTGDNRISRRDAAGKVTVFREDAGANGLYVDPQGRLVVCEARRGRVTRTELDGSITVLADSFEGKRFNQPNDLTMDSKGRIYFSDPRYGARDGMEILDAAGKPIEGVYRIDAPGKVVRVIAHEVDRPNGLLVSPGDEYLYVADNNNNTVGGARKLWRFNLRPDGSVDFATRKLIFDWKGSRGPDGLEMDAAGRLFVAGGITEANRFETTEFKGGVYVLSPAGKLLDFVPIPVDEVTNVAFGGPNGKTLFVTAGGTLWEMAVK